MSKNNLFKFVNGKFVMTEGYGSVINEAAGPARKARRAAQRAATQSPEQSPEAVPQVEQPPAETPTATQQPEPTGKKTPIRTTPSSTVKPAKQGRSRQQQIAYARTRAGDPMVGLDVWSDQLSQRYGGKGTPPSDTSTPVSPTAPLFDKSKAANLSPEQQKEKQEAIYQRLRDVASGKVTTNVKTELALARDFAEKEKQGKPAEAAKVAADASKKVKLPIYDPRVPFQPGLVKLGTQGGQQSPGQPKAPVGKTVPSSTAKQKEINKQKGMAQRRFGKGDPLAGIDIWSDQLTKTYGQPNRSNIAKIFTDVVRGVVKSPSDLLSAAKNFFQKKKEGNEAEAAKIASDVISASSEAGGSAPKSTYADEAVISKFLESKGVEMANIRYVIDACEEWMTKNKMATKFDKEAPPMPVTTESKYVKIRDPKKIVRHQSLVNFRRY